MEKLSVVIITFNEEHNISRCIQSVQSVADEVVVVDSYSTDKTVELATSLGAKVYQHTFEGHIQQKNYALTKSSYDIVLSLDADEALDNLLQHQVRLTKRDFRQEGYYFKRLTNYCGHWVRYCGWYPDKKLRLFKKSMGKWSGRNPHDKFELFKGDLHTQTLSGNILHYSYYTVGQHLKQTRYFAKIAATEMYNSGKDPYKLQLLINPFISFLKSYFIKMGILDGWRGLQICSISAFSVFLKYRLLFQLKKSKTF